MKKREHSYTVGGNVKWFSHYGKQYGVSFKKLKIELPCYPAIPLLIIYPETSIQKDTCTPMFIAAVFTIDKTWKQPEDPSTDDWLKRMSYIYTYIYIYVYIYAYIYIHTHIYIANGSISLCVCICMCVHACTPTHNGTPLRHKKNDILPFSATRINLENIIFSEVRQTDKYCMILLVSGI